MRVLAPIPKQFEDSNGVPYANGKVTVYLHGSTSLAKIYQEAEGNALAPNPTILDSHGAWNAFVYADPAYDYVVQDEHDNVIFSYSNISVSGDVGSSGEGSIDEIAMFDLSQAGHGLYDDIDANLVAGLLPIIYTGSQGRVRYYYYTARDLQAHTMTFTCGYDGSVELLVLKDDDTYGYSSPTGDSVKYTLQTKNDNEKLQARLNIGAAALLSLAPAFSTSTAYDEGDVVTYNGALYIFDTAHAAGAWTGADAHETNIMEVLAMAAGATEKPTTIISAPIYVGGNSAQLDIYTYANNNHSKIVTFTGQCLLDFRPNAGVTTNPIGGNALDVVSFSRNNKLKIKRARITTQGSQGIGAANGQKAAQLLLLGYKVDGAAVASVDYFYLAIDNYNEWQDVNATYDVAKNGPFSAPSFDLKIVENINDTTSKLTIDDYNLQSAYEGQKLQAWLELEVETDSIA